MSEPHAPEYGEIIAGSRYTHALQFREADGVTAWDVSGVYESYRATVRRNGSLFEESLAELAVDDDDASNGNVHFTLTAEQTRYLNGQITEGLFEVQAVVVGETDPDTLYLLDVVVIGDAAR